MKRILALVGALALLGWTALGLFAWASAARRVTVDVRDEQSQDQQAAELRALRDELGVLQQDVRALAAAMGEGMAALEEAVRASGVSHESVAHAPNAQPEASKGEPLAATSVEPLAGAAVEAGHASPDPASARTSQADGGNAPRKSFLAFRLPSDDLRFDERRSWSVLPSLSRVGFDAKSTLHDFTATTSELEGELEADLSRPGDAPRALIRVRTESLTSGNAQRDEEMREILAPAKHPVFEFELRRFEAGEIDVAAQRGAGAAHGRMTLRGVTQEVAMPVRLSLDDARRLCVEGEMTLDLTRFQVPVPSKLGLITMEKEIRLWISLRLRVDPRSKG